MECNMVESTRKFWNDEVSAAQLEYPNEIVVRYLASHRKQGGKVLDFGCGAGRHSVLIKKMGYSLVAMDYNQSSLDITRSKLETMGAEDFELVQNHNTDVPLESNTLDYILAWGSLFYNREADIKILLGEMNRVLKMSGEIFADWRSTNDYLYMHGTEIEPYLFYLDETSGRPGVLYYFATIDNLKKIYDACGFEIINCETYEFTQKNGKNLNSWYHVTAKKIRNVR
jgi:ubiquinone/menaquinone biosynthesis C-methylase UbiE